MALKDSLVAYYKMEGNSNDAIGSNNGTDTSISYGTSHGKVTQGASFNGSTSKIDLVGMGLLSDFPGLTISAWVKIPLGSTAGCIAVLETSANGDTVALNAFSNGTNLVGVYDPGSNNVILTQIQGSIRLDDGAWHHVVGVTVRAGTIASGPREAYMYVDGQLEGAATGTVVNVTPNDAAIGYDLRNNINYITGDVDEVGFWSRALTADEVLLLYNGGAGLQYPFYRSGAGILLPLMV